MPDSRESPSHYPPGLREIIALFENLPENERRETLITFAENSASCVPEEGEKFDYEDVRKDAQCTDTVGIFLRMDEAGRAHFKVSLGNKVQTLTRAMTAIMCRSINGLPPAEILAIPHDFIPKIVGAELYRQRSQTVYYILSRMQEAVGKKKS